MQFRFSHGKNRVEQPVEYGAQQEEEAEEIKKVVVPFLTRGELVLTAQSFFPLWWNP